MVNSPFARKQDRQQPYPPQQPEPAAPPAAVAMPTPVVQFASAEAAHSVITPLREKYDNQVTFANAEWEQAFRCAADIDGWQAEIADLQKRIDARSLDKRQHLHHAQQACDVANPAAVLLGMAGVRVPQITPPPAFTSPAPAIPALHVADLKLHPADAGQGDEQVLENPPDGFCIHCGEAVWRTAVSKTSPNGCAHTWGSSCNPDDPNAKDADLGEGREVAS